MQQGGAYRSGTESDLLAGDLGDCYRMKDIGFSAAAPDAAVGLFGETVGPFDNLYLFTVIRRQIAVQDLLEGRFNHAVLFRGGKAGFGGWRRNGS